jgi:plastocyanin
MPSDWKLFATVFVLAATTACGGGEKAPQRTAPPDAKRVDASKAATVTGRVTIDGAVPRNEPIKITGDPACAREHKNGATFETFVSENGGLGNVFVYVKDGLSGYFFDTPSESVKLDQIGCMYRPHVFGVQAGQNIEIINSDPLLHTVHAVGNTNPEFQVSQPIQTQKDVKFFTKPEVMVRFKCDIHSWMSAYAGVLDHPYFAVTKPAGTFELKNLPAGTYTLEAWHEKLGTQTQKVTVADNDKKEIGFTFKTPATTEP